jgi:O-antigen biosynthesis protein WbqP
MASVKKNRFYHPIKYTLDFIVALFSMLILGPLVFLPISLLIKLTSKGPIFFKQKRIGIHKKEFFLIKFRTMRVDTPSDTPTHLLKNPKSWITPVGKFLRKTSLDELPQLLNVLKGDISIIGPRPALWNQLDLIQERDALNIHSIKPGMSGWAQVNGRDTLTIKEKVALDYTYLTKESFVLDIKIIFKTIIKLFYDQNVVEGGTNHLGKKE